MIEQTDKPWYIARRGELLAEQFLLELEPHSLSPIQNLEVGIDFMAFFLKPDGSLTVIGIKVKATQQEIRKHIAFSASQARKLLNVNIPVLVIVVDVKSNEIYFNWIHKALSSEQKEALDKMTSCSIHLRKATADERKTLKQEIIQGAGGRG